MSIRNGTPSPSLAARGWVGALRTVGAAGELTRAARSRRDRRAAEAHLAEARQLEERAFVALRDSRAAYLERLAEPGDEPELPETEPAPEPPAAPANDASPEG
jgi:hypothetical protein